jgi:hypothetical protein
VVAAGGDAGVSGDDAVVFGAGAAVFGDGVGLGVELAGAVEGACCASAALVAASNVTVASSPAAIHADLRCWLIGLASGSSDTEKAQFTCL